MSRKHTAAAEHDGHTFARADAHDRMACVTCDVWVEPQCRCAGDHCEFFTDAPARPSLAVLEMHHTARA